MRRTLIFALVATGCGGSRATPSRPLGVDENLAEARRHEAEAQQHDRQAEAAETRTTRVAACSDVVAADQVTSGGERLLSHSPCWTASDDEAHHRALAADLRHDAQLHRQRADALAAAERVACADMPKNELGHTPFMHREDIATVTAVVERDRVRGARIRFRPVPGLTADWLRAAIACHQARSAALGWPPTHFGYDPTLLAGTTVTVETHGTAVLVTVRSDDDATAQAVYGRAEDLLDPETP